MLNLPVEAMNLTQKAKNIRGGPTQDNLKSIKEGKNVPHLHYKPSINPDFLKKNFPFRLLQCFLQVNDYSSHSLRYA